MAEQKARGRKAKPTSKHPLKVNGKDWDRQAVMEVICHRIATSSKGLSTILTMGYQGYQFPKYGVLYRWMKEDESLNELYLRAKVEQAEFLADEMLDIADDGRNDFMAMEEQKTGKRFHKEHVQRTRLRLETRKWLMAKLKPRKYGERVEQDVKHSVGDDLLDALKPTLGPPSCRGDDGSK